MTSTTHFRDPMLSVWQSAVAKVAAEDPRSRNLASLENHRFVAATSVVASAIADHLEKQPDGLTHLDAVANATRAAVAYSEASAAAATSSAVPSAAAALPIDCAAFAFQLAQARLGGDDAKAADLQRYFKFGTCDGGWLDCVTEFLAHFPLRGQAAIPYQKWKGQDQFVLTDLPDKATIAIAGDWGTGEQPAIDVMIQMAAKNPDLFIHLGDIYYSGTPQETEEHFYSICRDYLGKRCFTLAGNHDMYSGGQGYYQLLNRLGQPASFFCLRNSKWQILAMDTGYNDFNPLHVSDAVTTLREDQGYSEAAWHIDKINNAQGRRTIVLSHHQLFSAASPIGGNAVNQKLQGQLAGVMPKIDLWLWGHEHSHIIFEDGYAGLPKGRCIGASAVPVSAVDPNQDPYRTAAVANPPKVSNYRLSKNKEGSFYNLGYAILRLDGESATLDHFDSSLKQPFHSENI